MPPLREGSPLVSSEEKVELKSKIAVLFAEISKQKEVAQKLTLLNSSEPAAEDGEPKSEVEMHREKIYRMEERSHQLEMEALAWKRVSTLVEEAKLYTAIMSNEAFVM